VNGPFTALLAGYRLIDTAAAYLNVEVTKNDRKEN
jgi:diketogulonate reductase-like aldo/keto reductase